MKTKTTKQANKAKKNRLLTVGPGYRYAGIIHARVALKAGEHKLQRVFVLYSHTYVCWSKYLFRLTTELN